MGEKNTRLWAGWPNHIINIEHQTPSSKAPPPEAVTTQNLRNSPFEALAMVKWPSLLFSATEVSTACERALALAPAC